MKAAAHTDFASAELTRPEDAVDTAAQDAPKKRRVTKLRTLGTFLRRGACSDTLMTVLDRADGHPMDLEERATDPLAGGMMQGYQCGMVWGSTLAAGAQAHRRFGAGPEAEAAAMRAAAGVVSAFRERHGSIDCLDITEADPRSKWQTFKYHLLKGGVATCARRMARFAPVAHQEIEAALAEERPATSCDPASCASRLARMAGASEQHATMAAGLAGGIGLSGGACGALGAAIWLLGIEGQRQGLSTKAVTQQIEALNERFQQATDYEYECAGIVGRTFASIEDHSAHVRGGGCAALLLALAAAVADVTAPAPVSDDAPRADGEAVAG